MMTVGASCVVNPRSWPELLLDSAASLRLVDSTLAELYSASAGRCIPVGQGTEEGIGCSVVKSSDGSAGRISSQRAVATEPTGPESTAMDHSLPVSDLR